MLGRRSILTAAAVMPLVAIAGTAMAQAAGKTYYWISHGGPADPVWTYFLAGARSEERRVGKEC